MILSEQIKACVDKILLIPLNVKGKTLRELNELTSEESELIWNFFL
jgi:hypothetical protein